MVNPIWSAIKYSWCRISSQCLLKQNIPIVTLLHANTEVLSTGFHFIGDLEIPSYSSLLKLTLALLHYWLNEETGMMTSSNGNIFCVTGPLCGEFTGPRWQRPVTRNFGVFFDLHLNKRLRKQSWGWWFETPSRPLWRHCDVVCEHFCELGTLQ